MKRYRKWVMVGVALTTVGVLAGCGSAGINKTTGATPTNNTVVSTNTTNEVNSTTRVFGNNLTAVSQNGTGTSNNTSDTAGTGHSAPSQIPSNVLTLSVKLSNRTSLPSNRLGDQPYPVTELRSAYGTLQASTPKKTTTPLRITLTNHGSNRLIYVDSSKSLKWLMGWQLSGNYLLLNIGEPTPGMVTGDFGGEVVVINLKTNRVALKQSIGMESQQGEFITPTALVSLWVSLTGPGYSVVEFYTSITNLATDKTVTLESTNSRPLGQDPYAIGNRVYFSSGQKVYYIEIPAAAWSGGGQSKPYQLVLRPSVKITS